MIFMKKGIDVYSGDGDIDYNKLNVDFIMIRAGYGKVYDDKLERNVVECLKRSIPFGFYWFSYALSIADAEIEAKMCCDIADKYKPELPLAYDWEYESDNWCARNGINNSNMINKARAFLNYVDMRGYIPMLYTNLDYWNKGFSQLGNQFDIWFANYDTSKPTINCYMHQYTDKLNINGYYFDGDIIYSESEIDNKAKLKKRILNKVSNYLYNKYYRLAEEIIDGVYGDKTTIPTRKENVEAAGYDYDVAQIFVTEILQ